MSEIKNAEENSELDIIEARIADFKDISDIEEIYKLIVEKEEELDGQFKSIFTKQCNVESKMSGIGKILSALEVTENESKTLSNIISNTAALAESVSAKVRKLDEARNRVSECQKRVHDLIDLQLCSQGVIAAIKDDNFEEGAGHISRFLSMDQKILQKTADDVTVSVTSITKALHTLEEATIKMRDLISQKFDEAVYNDDLASVERFFKIFPLLGMHDVGIKKFSIYICKKLENKSQKEMNSSLDIAKAEKRLLLAFADTLTTLLENFARVIEINQPIINTYYGYGYLLQMYEILQNECDKEIKQLILEFNKNRQIMKRVTQINDIFKSGGSSNHQNLGHYKKGSGGGGGSDGLTDRLNPKDIDSVIVELTVMHSRSELYFRFMQRRLINDINSSNLEENDKQIKIAKSKEIALKSHLSRQMQELLGTYLLFERFFMEESVLKAIALDTFESGQQCSSMVDDVFFIIRKCIRRSITTQSMNGICAVINNATSCFEGDFVNALRTPLKSGYPSGYIDLAAQAYNVIQSSIQQGKLQTNDSEQARMNFLVQLNNADMSTEYIETLWITINEEVRAAFLNMSNRDNEIFESCMSDLKSVKNSLKTIVDFGMQQLRSSAIKPRLNSWVDQFSTYNHQLTEEELSSYEAGETFVQFLIVQIDSLLASFKNTLTPRNYDTLVGILASEVTARLEKAIRKATFNRLGGLILDQEVRALGTYLTNATSWSVRDKMARLTQISTLLNLEKVSELTEYWNPGKDNDMPTWRISPTEIKQILTLRTDFRMEDIKRLKL